MYDVSKHNLERVLEITSTFVLAHLQIPNKHLELTAVSKHD